MATYLLPCSCGRETPVEPRQAGETVLCECGRTCAVPTMREIQNLHPASIPFPTTTATAKPAWGNPQRFLVVGLMVFVLAVIVAIVLYRQIPPRFAGIPSPEAEREIIKHLSLVQKMLFFHHSILPGIEIPQQAQARSESTGLYLGLAAMAGLGAIGLIFAGIGAAKLGRRR